MKRSRIVVYFLCLFALVSLASCQETRVDFTYALRIPDASGVATNASSCDEAGVDAVRLMFGSDSNGNGTLDDDEIQDEDTDECRIRDTDIGTFKGNLLPGEYDTIAIEFLDTSGSPLSWSTSEFGVNATRISKPGFVLEGSIKSQFIDFSGAGAALAAFFGF